ncbi:MAG: hypothetical protein OXR66_03820 [Candidatus Woesearchaeota archaeon]|nr:hypothetical protein [Candidatus Woesearchaeota archaeon]
MFIRVKTISGKKYAYLVENTWKNGKTKQRVKKYLGALYKPEKLQEMSFTQWKNVELESYMNNTPLKKIIRDLVQHCLWLHGFLGKPPARDGFSVDLMKGNVLKRKAAVIQMHDGYLSTDTFRALFKFKPVEEETRGEKLAEALVKAGLKVEKDVFILLYRKIYNI